MSTLSAIVLTGAVAVAGGVAGFRHVVDDPSTQASADVTGHAVKHSHPVRVVGKPVVHIKVKPCGKGFARTHGQCVRHVQRTVVVNVPAPATSAPQPVQAPPTTTPVRPVSVGHAGPVRSDGEHHSGTAGGHSDDGGGHEADSSDGGEHEGPPPAGSGGESSGSTHEPVDD